MRTTMSLRTAVLVSTALLAVPSAALATPSANGKIFNTDALNGKIFNGKIFNGQALEPVYASGAWKDGYWLWDTHVDGSGLTGWAYNYAYGYWEFVRGDWYVGTDVNARFVNAIDGATEDLRLHIDAVAEAEQGSDVLLHWVTVHSTVDTYDQWQNIQQPTSYPLCTDASGNAVPAILLRGEWSQAEGVPWGGDQISDDPYRMTFSCVTGALGKCAADCTDPGTCEAKGVPFALGYARWRAPQWWAVDKVGGGIEWHWRDYAMEHQSCTRMIRADYCGDGISHTENGTPIDVYDKMRDNKQSADAVIPAWFYDSTWNEDGAVTITCERVTQAPVSCTRSIELGSGMTDIMVAIPGGITTTYPLQCLTGDGMTDPAARMGNLRKAPEVIAVLPWLW